MRTVGPDDIRDEPTLVHEQLIRVSSVLRVGANEPQPMVVPGRAGAARVVLDSGQDAEQHCSAGHALLGHVTELRGVHLHPRLAGLPVVLARALGWLHLTLPRRLLPSSPLADARVRLALAEPLQALCHHAHREAVTPPGRDRSAMRVLHRVRIRPVRVAVHLLP